MTVAAFLIGWFAGPVLMLEHLPTPSRGCRTEVVGRFTVEQCGWITETPEEQPMLRPAKSWIFAAP
jgi:hypothetical protein